MGSAVAAEDRGAARLAPLEERPGVLLIGAPNVGKRTLLSKLLSVDLPEASDLSAAVFCLGWTIQTKYYSADLSIWTAHLEEGLSFGALPISKQLDALVMVFDMSDESSFTALQDWVANVDIEKFEILLCIGNKADLVPGHYAHGEYRRRLQKHGESTSDPHPEYLDYGIYETEGCSLLGDEELSSDIKKSCLDWCSQHSIEYIEACASNAEFDKCLSIDGDIQGVERLYGALSAHMWPGMVLKSGNRITTPTFNEKEEMTDDESDYEIEYEILSGGPDEHWEDVGESSVTLHKEIPATNLEEEVTDEPPVMRIDQDDNDGAEAETSTASISDSVSSALPSGFYSARNIKAKALTGDGTHGDQYQKQEGGISEEQKPAPDAEASNELGSSVADFPESDEDAHLGFEELERLMGEISNMRDNLRLMPDFQRREMAAKLAMKVAAMFGDSSDEDAI